jgi:hypothetical protein
MSFAFPVPVDSGSDYDGLTESLLQLWLASASRVWKSRG